MTQQLFLNIADFNIAITFFIDPEFEQFEKSFIQNLTNNYQGFIENKKPIKIDFEIKFIHNTNFKVLINPKQKTRYIIFYQQIARNKISTFYHISRQQFQLLIRDVCQILLSKNSGIILHGSASLLKKGASIFLGNSGAGKSTIMTILSAKYPPLADDTFIVKKNGIDYFFYQTPFIEKNSAFKKTNQKYPIEKICILEKAKINQIKQIPDKGLQIFYLTKQLFSEQKDIKKQMKLLLNFLAGFENFYQLSFSLNNQDKLLNLFK